jgi:hypothetical protein
VPLYVSHQPLTMLSTKVASETSPCREAFRARATRDENQSPIARCYREWLDLFQCAESELRFSEAVMRRRGAVCVPTDPRAS